MPAPSFWESPKGWWKGSSGRKKALSIILVLAIGATAVLLILYLSEVLSFEHLLVGEVVLAGVELVVGIYIGLLELEDFEREEDTQLLRELLAEVREIRTRLPPRKEGEAAKREGQPLESLPSPSDSEPAAPPKPAG